MISVFLRIGMQFPSDTKLHRHSQYSLGTFASMAALASKLTQFAITGRIKTVPMFHISERKHLTSPCLFYAVEPRFAGLEGTTGQNPFTHSIFSGIYRIIGWKHIISPGEISSNFTVIKNITEDLEPVVESATPPSTKKKKKKKISLEDSNFNQTVGNIWNY